ncbi:MAG: tetratricopeptide repeat protein, partial [Deltaproteobacteria bacterium]
MWQRIFDLHCCVLLVLSLFGYGGAAEWTQGAIRLGAFSLLASALCYRMARRHFTFSLHQMEGIILLFLLLSVAMIPFSTLPSVSWAHWLRHLDMMIVFLAISQTMSRRRRLEHFVFAWVIVGGGMALLALLLPASAPNPERGISGTFFNHSHFAGFLELTLPLALSLLLAPPSMGGGGRFVGLLATAVMFLALLQSRSYGAYWSMGLALPPFLALRFLPRPDRLRSCFLLFVVAGMILSIVAVRFVATRESPSEDHPLEERIASASGRVETWRATLGMVKDHPWIGVGQGGFRWCFAPYKPATIPKRIHTAHNDVLEFVAERGIPFALLSFAGMGYLFLLSFRIFAWEKIRRTRWIGVGSLTALIAIAFHEVYDFNLLLPANRLLFFLHLSLLAILLKRATPPALFVKIPYGRWGETKRRRFLRGVAITALLCLGVGLATGGRELAAALYADRGRKLARMDAFQQAKSSQRRAILLRPHHPGYRHDLARTLLAEGERYPSLRPELLEAARKEVEYALDRFEEDPEIWVTYARILAQQGEEKRALAAYQKAIALAPTDYYYRYLLGTFHLAHGDPGAALLSFRFAVEFFPNLLERLLERVERELGPDPRMMAAIVPPKPSMYLRFAAFLQQRGMQEARIEVLERLTRLEPDVPKYHHLLAHALERAGQLTRFREVVRDYLARFPNDAEGPNQFGNLFLHHGDLAAALEMFETAFQRDRSHLRNRIDRASIYCRLDRFSEAEREFTALLLRSADDPYLRYHQAHCLLRQGAWFRALQAAKKAVENDVTNVEYRLFLSQLYLERGME